MQSGEVVSGQEVQPEPKAQVDLEPMQTDVGLSHIVEEIQVQPMQPGVSHIVDEAKEPVQTDLGRPETFDR